MHHTAKTIKEFLESLPEDRREAIINLRRLILKTLPLGYKEGLQYGMISYFIPLEQYPNTYNGQPLSYISLTSQKNHMSLYLMCAYSDSTQDKVLRDGFAKDGKKLDMGKSCIRFKKLEDLSLPTIEKVIASTTPKQFIQIYERARNGT